MIAAIDHFFSDSDRLDHRTRVLAYMADMEQLNRAYHDDREIAVFYSLALIAAGTMDNDQSFEKQLKAGAILNAVLRDEPDHPGVSHYLIHSFDYPKLARLALPAALRYATIAPASAHAQHMPSHIFVRLGMWDDAINSNRAAESAARTYAQSHGLADSWDERLHAMDYLVYAYLQTGRDNEAQHVLDELIAIRRVDPPNFKVAYAVTAIPARLALEQRNWKGAALLALPPQVIALAPFERMKWAEAHINFARAIGAARSNNAQLARQQVAKLAEIERALAIQPGEYDWSKQVSIERQIAQGWLDYAEKRKDEAVRHLSAAADLDDATEKHPVTPGSILPAREQLGELLLEIGRPGEALREFEMSLARAPRRLAGLYGAARAADSSGNRALARKYYADLVALTQEGDMSRHAVAEARAYLTAVEAQ